jgi:hypothetical protein
MLIDRRGIHAAGDAALRGLEELYQGPVALGDSCRS